MSAQQFISSVCLICLMFACKKENPQPGSKESLNNGTTTVEVYDTIPPSNWFPAYPGSYWNYSDGTNYSVDASYSLHNYYLNTWPNPNFPSPGGTYTQYYLPTMTINGADSRAIYNYSFLPHGNTYEPDQFYHESLTDWSVPGNWGTTKSYHVISRDTSLNINGTLMDSLTYIREYQSPNASPGDAEYWGVYKFYKKNIGMVRMEWRNPTDSTIQFMELTDYFIND